MPGYEEEIQNIMEMLEKKDARGLDNIIYRYEEMGMGMIWIAMYHGIKKQLMEKENEDS